MTILKIAIYVFVVLHSITFQSAVASSHLPYRQLFRSSAANLYLEETVQRLAQSINYSVDPCNDFYGFSCGNWAQANSAPRHANTYDHYDIFNDRIAENLRKLIEENIANANDNASEWIETTFYQKCLDRDRIDKHGHRPMEKLLERLSGGHKWPILFAESNLDAFDWQHFYAELFPLDVNSMISITYFPDPQNDHRNHIMFEPPKLQTNPAELDQIIRIFSTTQIDANQIDQNIVFERIFEIINFELQLNLMKSTVDEVETAQMSLITFDLETRFKIDWTGFLNQILRSSMRQFSAIVHGGKLFNNGDSDLNLIKQSLGVFQSAFELAQQKSDKKSGHSNKHGKLPKLIDHSQLELIKRWLNSENVISELMFNLFNSPMYTTSDLIYVYDVAYFVKLAKLLQSTPKHVLYNYMGWKMISRYRNYIGGQAREMFVRFDQELEPDKPAEPLWKHCITRVIKVYSWNVSHRYVKRFVPKRIKEKVSKLVELAKFSFEELIRHSNWLDNSTKEMAMEKLHTMKEFVAYPDWLLVDFELDKKVKSNTKRNLQSKRKRKPKYHETEFFQMAIEKLCFNRIWQLLILKFTSRNDFHGWSDAPIVVGAYHSPSTNSIAIPFSMLQAPLYHTNQPAALNFGGLVPIISHELIHGFDTIGGLYDSMGNYFNWWAPQSKARFNSKAQCFMQQYDQIVEPNTGFKLNGISTVGENIADNGAIRVAYSAFLKTTKSTHLQHQLVHLENFTSDQVFFIQHAQTFCGQISLTRIADQIQWDTHSPEKYRVNVPLSNFEPFSAAFHCPVRSEMNRDDKCVAWK